MGAFDDLVPQTQDTRPSGGAFDDLVPEAAKAEPAPQQSAGLGTALLSSLQNVFLGAKQGTSPMLMAWDKKDDRVPVGEVTAVDDGGNFYFDTPNGQQRVDLSQHTILKDPSTGKAMVFPNDPKYAESGLKGAARIVSQGLVTGPATGPAASAAINVPRAASAAEKATQAAEDMSAIERAGVSVPGVAFSTSPTMRVSKALSETPLVGAPMRNAIEDSYSSIRNAVTDVADDMSRADTFDKGGYALQKGLDRYQRQGINKLEPETLRGQGIEPTAPVKPTDIMSKAAAERVSEAEPIRVAAGGKEGLTRTQLLTARRSAEDLSDAELQTLIRTPSNKTSFKARAEALYEDAYRAIPVQMRNNNTANPQRLSAVNLRNTMGGIDADVASQIGGQGTLTGELADRIRKATSHFSFDDLRRIRTQVGEALSGATDQTLSTTQLKQIYGAVSRDIEVGLKDISNRAYIASKLPKDAPNHVPIDVAKKADAALNKFRLADRYYRQSMERIDRFRTVIDARNPERAMQRLVEASQAGGKGDIGLIRSALSVLRPEERADVSAVILRNLGKPLDSARGAAQSAQFSPTTFVTRISKMDPRAFDAMFPGEHGAAIKDLFKAANRVSNIDALANVSGSGTNVLNVGGLGWAVTTAWGGDVVTPMLVGSGGWGLSYLLSRPEYAKWAAGMMNLRANSMAAPGKFNAQIASHVNRLGEFAKRDPQLLPVYRAFASENGIVKGGSDEQPKDGQVEQPSGVQPSKEGQGGKLQGHQGMDKVKGGPAQDVIGELPRLPPLPGSSPSLMGDALATSDWGEPSTDYPDTVSGRVARTTDKFKDDVQFLREHPGDVGSAALAGLIDFGGATSKISNYLGQGDTAKAIERNKEKAPGVAGVAGMTPLALPGILAEGAEGAYQTANPEPPVNVISRDEFFQARRKPRETLEQAAARAEKEFRESPTYIDLNKRNMVKVANRELSNAVERAKQTWKESQSGIGGEEKAIEADYQAYLQDMNKKLEAEHAKGFSERNPWFKTVVGLGSLASGGLAALGLRSIAKKGDKLLDAAAAAKATGDAEKMSRAKMALEHWDKWRLPKQTLAVGLPATVPMDVRGLADVVDAYGLPQTYFDAEGNIQPVLANERAREHLQPQNFIADSLPAIASGLVGAGVGAKFARKAPTEAVSAELKPLPASKLNEVAKLETANAAASAKIAQARQGLAKSKAELDADSLAHERQLARSLATPSRSSGQGRPSQSNTPSGPQTSEASGAGQVGGGTTKALPSPKATDATKNKFWDDVQAALKEGRDITTLKAEDYPGLTDRMLKERFTRVKSLQESLQGRKTPKALANLIEQIRKNDSWKLGVAGASLGAAGVASMDDKTE